MPSQGKKDFKPNKSWADTIFLQDMHLKGDSVPVFKPSKFPIQIQTPGTSKARGVGILFSACLRVTFDEQNIDPMGRFIFINTQIDDSPFTLASVYGLNLD